VIFVCILQLGTLGFGGPVALVGYMHRDLVEHRKWISEDDYREGMALSQLPPGPLAAQLGIFLGYVHHGILGATLAGGRIRRTFIFHGVRDWLGIRRIWRIAVDAGRFYGVGAAVIGIITVSSYKLTTKSIGKDWLLWNIFVILAITTFLLEQEILWLILFGRNGSLAKKTPPSWFRFTHRLIPVMLVQAQAVTFKTKLWQIAWFFTKAGAFVFGSGLAIVPFLYGGVVKEYACLN
jgi:chromate transporter